jgi:hypothetical protein
VKLDSLVTVSSCRVRSDAYVTVRETRRSIALNRSDRLLSGNEDPPLGAHLVTPRFAFAHHGVYLGGRKVMHYGAVPYQLRGAPVEEVAFSFFAHGHPVYVRPHAAPRFDRNEVIDRARSRLGEDRYALLRNNCEHFCEWCVQGVARSHQVECALRFPRALLHAARAALPLLGPNSHLLARSRRVVRVLPARFSA